MKKNVVNPRPHPQPFGVGYLEKIVQTPGNASAQGITYWSRLKKEADDIHETTND